MVGGEGRSGGLAMLWQNDLNLSITNYSQFHISSCITKEGGHSKWFLTGVYGHLETACREETWRLLKTLHAAEDNDAWLVIGDFNEIICREEKRGGRVRA